MYAGHLGDTTWAVGRHVMYFLFCFFLDQIKVFELVLVLLNNQKDIYSIYKSTNICFCWTKLSEPLLQSLYQKLQVSRLSMLSIERLKLFVAPKKDAVVFPTFSDQFLKRDLHYQQWIWKQPYRVRLCACIILCSDTQIYNFRSNNETKLRFLGSLKEKEDGNEMTTT